jgi:phosphatidylglycerophosphate synthase
MTQENNEKLHRLQSNHNDWDDIKDEDLSRLQRIAKKSHGIITAANAITIAGTVAVINGLSDFADGRKVEGTAKVLVGRLGDIADGAVADKTKTKGRFGRDLDPTVDKIQLAAGLVILTGADVLPIAATVAVAAPNIIGSIGSIAARKHGVEVNPSASGKHGAAAVWLGVGAFMLKNAIEKHSPGLVDSGLEAIGWAGTVGGAALSLPAAVEYSKAGFSENLDK